MKKEALTELMSLVFAHVFTDEAAFIDTIAKEFAIGNSGQEVEDFIEHMNIARLAQTPGDVISYAWSTFMGRMEDDEMYNGANAEKRAWTKDAKKMVQAIKLAGVPMTMQNAHDAWEKKGVFAAKK